MVEASERHVRARCGRRRLAVMLAVSIAGVASCREASGPARSSEAIEQSVVYGDDDRLDVYAHPDEAWKSLARQSIAAMVYSQQVDLSDPNHVSIQANTLAETRGLCPDQRFRDHPAGAHCSATLVDRDLMLTAGHCIDAPSCADEVFLFDYFYEAEGQLAHMTADSVYRCREVVARHFTLGGIDMAVVRLDRPVTPDRRPARLRRLDTPLEEGTEVVLMGFPSGIPLKIAGGGRVVDNRAVERDFFETTVDAFGGNSGSGIFNAQQELVGILARGKADYVLRDNCAAVAHYHEQRRDAEHATYVHHAVKAVCEDPDHGAPQLCLGEEGSWCYACAADDECLEGFVCGGRPEPGDRGSCVRPCEADDGCRDDHVCQDGVCAPRMLLTCRDNDVWQVNACGRYLGVDQACPETHTCRRSECLERDPGDLCANATPIEPHSQLLRGTFGPVTTNDYQGSCAGNGLDRVFRFVLEAPTAVTLFSVATFDTVVYLRQSCGDPGTELTCNDDSSPPGAWGSRIAVELDAGEYFIFLDAYRYGDGGEYVMAINFGGLCDTVCEVDARICHEGNAYHCGIDENGCFRWSDPQICGDEGQRCLGGDCVVARPGDWCHTAVEIDAVDQVLRDDLEGYGPDHVGTCAGAGPERVYSFQIAERTRLSATATGFDSVLYVTSDCANPQAEAACNDDAAPPGELGSHIEAILNPGRHFLVVDAFGQPGAFELDLSFSSDCEHACDTEKTRCTGGLIQSCRVNEMGCREWSEGESCPEGELCDEGACRPVPRVGVPGDHPSLQAALDASDGNVIIDLPAGAHTVDATIDAAIIILGSGRAMTTLQGRFVVSEHASLGLANLTLQGDSGSGLGTGIDSQGGAVRLDFAEVRGFGSGVRAVGGLLIVWGSRLVNNVWGADVQGATVYLINDELVNNTKAGVLDRGGSQLAVAYSTIVGNGFAGTPDNGGGIFAGPDTVGQIYDNIVVGNRWGINCRRCQAELAGNDVWGNTEDYVGDASPGYMDFSLDPQFVNPAEQDFRLTEGSPCIDTAVDVGVTTDALGRARPWGDGFDVGAHEYVRVESGLVINEVMANPLNEGTGEFVELYNGTGFPVDVRGAVISDGDATNVIVAWMEGPTVIPADGFGVVVDPDYDPLGDPATGGYEIAPDAVIVTVEGARLGNGLATSDPVELLASDGQTVVSTYGHPFNPGNGVSAERIAPDAGDEPGTWVPSPCSLSPGAPNCAAAVDPEPTQTLVITEVMANPIDEGTGEFVEILNMGESPIDLAGLLLSDGDADDIIEPWHDAPTLLPVGAYAVVLDRDFADEYVIPPEAIRVTIDDRRIGNALSTNDPVSLRNPDGELIGTYAYPFNPGNGRSAEMIDASAGDIATNWVAATCEAPPFASPGAPNCAAGGGVNPVGLTLVINEVMANPHDEDTGEFIELFNFGPEPVDAADLQIDDGDAVDRLVPVAGADSMVPPGAYAVILDPEYAGEYAIPDAAILLEPTNTTLGSGLATNDPITLRASDGVTVISTFGHPFNPGNGVSVERVDDRGDVPGNWVASPCASRASPGRPNCAGADPGDDLPIPGDETPLLVINEVMANPLAEGTGEFVEILNRGQQPVDVAGFVLSDGDATDQIEGFEGGPTLLPAGGFGLIVDRDYDDVYAIAEGAVLLTVGNRTLGSGLATNDPVALLLPDEATVIDTYGHPFNPGNGRSAERIDASRPDQPDNWLAAACDGDQQSSPGGPNCVAAAEPPPPAGQQVEVNTASAIELEQIRGIGPALAGQIVAHREAHGAFEDLRQLVVIDGISAGSVEDWARLEDGETFYLGISGADLRIRVTYDRVEDLLSALPDPQFPEAALGRVVRIRRAVNLTTGDTGRFRQLHVGDWGDETRYFPQAERSLPVFFEALEREETAVIDALADWDNQDGPPNGDDRFYRWQTRLPGAGKIREHQMFAIEGILGVYRGEWQLVIRPESAPGMDRLVLIERWIEPEDWRQLMVAWSYNYTPALVRAEGYSIRLPYRLVLAHPCVDWWVRVTGHAPPAPRRAAANDIRPGAYDEYNEALTAWRLRPQVPRLVINEILYDATVVVDTQGEMVELYNPNPDAVDLSGWRLEDDGGGYTFPNDGPVVPAWGYLALGNNPDAQVGGVPFVDHAYRGISLRNTTETIRLVDPSGGVIDEVTYDEGAPWPDGQAGYAYALIDPCADNADGAAWTLAVNDFAGRGHTFMTPGAPNSVMASTCPGEAEPD